MIEIKDGLAKIGGCKKELITEMMHLFNILLKADPLLIIPCIMAHADEILDKSLELDEELFTKAIILTNTIKKEIEENE